MRDFTLFIAGSDEPAGGSSSDPEFLDLFMEPGSFSLAFIKFQSGVPFLAHARKSPSGVEEIKVRMGVLEHVFERGVMNPGRLGTSSKPGSEFVTVPNLMLYLGQQGVRGLGRMHALLFPSGEISISFKDEELYALQKQGLTPGKIVRQAMQAYSDVFLAQFINR